MGQLRLSSSGIAPLGRECDKVPDTDKGLWPAKDDMPGSSNAPVSPSVLWLVVGFHELCCLVWFPLVFLRASTQLPDRFDSSNGRATLRYEESMNTVVKQDMVGLCKHRAPTLVVASRPLRSLGF